MCLPHAMMWPLGLFKAPKKILTWSKIWEPLGAKEPLSCLILEVVFSPSYRHCPIQAQRLTTDSFILGCATDISGETLMVCLNISV